MHHLQLAQFLNSGRKKKVLRQLLTHCSHLLIATSVPRTDQKRQKKTKKKKKDQKSTKQQTRSSERSVDLRLRENNQISQKLYIRSQYCRSFEIRFQIQIRYCVIYMFQETSNNFLSVVILVKLLKSFAFCEALLNKTDLLMS